MARWPWSTAWPSACSTNWRASMRSGCDGWRWCTIRWRWKVDAAGLAAHPRFRDPPDAMWRALSLVACPTLLVRGADSELLTAEAAERVVQSIPGAELCTIPAAGLSVQFTALETIHTESSYKFTRKALAALLDDAGFRIEQTWTDPREWYALTLASVG